MNPNIHPQMPEIPFPIQEKKPGDSFEETQKRIADECKVLPHLVTKSPEGKWVVQGIDVDVYKELYEISEGERKDTGTVR